MARFSISEIMARKNKLRIWTVLACLCLVSLSFFFITQNPKKSMARTYCSGDTCVIDANGYLDTDGNFNYYIMGTPSQIRINDQSDVTIRGNITVRTYGTQHFRSLTIRDNAVLSHDPLEPIHDFYVDSFALTPRGMDKKVDIVTTGDITLVSGGKINVDGKGYPGGAFYSWNRNEIFDYASIGSWCIEAYDRCHAMNGYGPGGGLLAESWTTVNGRGSVASGAGRISAGGTGKTSTEEDYTVNNRGQIVTFTREIDVDILGGRGYENSDSPSFDFGSGGGSAIYRDKEGSGQQHRSSNFGGAGGGRINLVVGGRIYLDDPASSISAKGQDEIEVGESINEDAAGGGGSGGTIMITGNMGFNTTISGYTAASAFGGEIRSGYRIKSGIAGGSGSIPIEPIYNVSVNGGIGGGGGSGGLIVFNPNNTGGVTIKKTLEAVKRGTNDNCDPVAGTNCFNPYALQVADQIRVRILVTNIVGTLPSLTDEVLKTVVAPIKKCVPAPATYTVLEGTAVGSSSNDIVTFRDITGNENGTAEMVYECKVQ